jgi:hypothetical protein
MSRKFLYRRSGLAVIVILGLLAVMAPSSAVSQGTPQLKRPQETTPEKLPEETKPKKKVKGPRAVGVLQLAKSGKSTLIPVAILVDGKFYDASAYKADPIPMALEGGTVYEAEQAGDSLGLFTINGALHSKAQGAPHPWVGAGSFLPKGTEAPKSTRKAEDVPVGMDSAGKSGSSSSDDRPRLKRGTAETPAPASNPASAPAPSGTPAGPGASSAPSEKPSTTAPSTASQPASGSSAGGSSGQDSAKPVASPASDKSASATQASKASSSQDHSSQDQASQGQASDNNYRPRLRRGKPTETAPQEYDAALADKSTSGKPAPLGAVAAATAEPVQLVAAISDGGGPDPRPYQFYWKPGEEDERRAQMLTLAENEVRAYANAMAKNRIPATPPPAATATAKSRKTPAKPVQPLLENIQFRTFDVWTTGQPVMILSAEAHFPAAPGTTAAPEQYSITLVARTDIYGSLRKLYAGVTDKFHLDVTPRLELIDAVDADGDGRGELLFRETTDAGSGYVIYRASADKLSKMFDSLSE